MSAPPQYLDTKKCDDLTDRRDHEEYLANKELEAQDQNSKRRFSTLFTIVMSAFGLANVGYQNNLMTMSNVIFKRLYPSAYTATVSTRVSNALLVGDIVGMIVVGLICDRIDRNTALMGTTFVVIVGTTLATAAHGAHSNLPGLFWFLALARGVTGVGVGGEYPASSTSASEAADERMRANRGPVLVTATYVILSIGGPLAISIFLIVLSAAGEDNLSTVWRVCFGIGIILPITVLYFRMRMPSSQLYRHGAIKGEVPYWLTIKRYWRPLIGTCGSWFIYDFVTYPNNIFSATIISSVIPKDNIKRTAEWQLLLGAIALPGAIVGVMLCNPLGRRNTMILGFAGYIVFGLIIGTAYEKITTITPLFVVLYGLMVSFGNLGPGDMTIVVSAESYATPVRGTLFGLSAVGKVGAVIGTQAFVPIQNNLGMRWSFIIAAICGLLGILVTYFFVPDMKGKDLASEDEKFVRYLSDNGWEGQVGEYQERTLSQAVVLNITRKDGSAESVGEDAVRSHG